MLAGSTTPTPVWLVPAQSPATGSQPGAPYWNTKSGAPEPGFSLRYQVSVAGSITPMPVWPLPVQSPVTGIQPGAPNWNGVAASRGPTLFSLRRYQVSVLGSTMPTV